MTKIDSKSKTPYIKIVLMRRLEKRMWYREIENAAIKGIPIKLGSNGVHHKIISSWIPLPEE